MQLALPFESATLEQPEIKVALSEKLAVPEGVPELPDTVSVYVALPPTVAGWDEEISEMLGSTRAGALTVCVTVLDVVAA